MTDKEKKNALLALTVLLSLIFLNVLGVAWQIQVFVLAVLLLVQQFILKKE